jgi:hypothetical protein
MTQKTRFTSALGAIALFPRIPNIVRSAIGASRILTTIAAGSIIV